MLLRTRSVGHVVLVLEELFKQFLGDWVGLIGFLYSSKFTLAQLLQRMQGIWNRLQPVIKGIKFRGHYVFFPSRGSSTTELCRYELNRADFTSLESYTPWRKTYA